MQIQTSFLANFKNLFISFVILFSMLLIKVKSGKGCGKDYLSEKPFLIYNNTGDDNKRFLQSVDYEPIRIYFDYTTLDNQNVSSSMISNLKEVLSNAQSIMQNLIKVKRNISPLSISACDPRVNISNSISTNGVNADVIIFPFFDSEITGTTEAFASACMISSSNNRPIAGIMAFSLTTNMQATNWLQFNTIVALHEMSHILVFSPSFYGLFVDSKGSQIPLSKVVKNTIVNGANVSLIITPRVVAEAQRHFNCSSVVGIELENQGGDGTSLSHWNARIMLNDYMIGVSYDEPAISEITLAFFEDSGWYQANYYTGGLFRFGKNEGCGFLNSKCINNQQVQYTNEYCNESGASMCMAGKTGKGFCYIYSQTTPIDPVYQYFTSNVLGGTPLADYCPVAEAPSNDTYLYPWNCQVGTSQLSSDFQESISDTSGCFMSSLIQDSVSSQYRYMRNNINSICYEFNCNFTSNTITVSVGTSSVTCPTLGGIVTMPGYKGNLTCPSFIQVCTTKTRCNNIIDCVNKKSIKFNNTDIYNFTQVNIQSSGNTNDNTVPSDASSVAPSNGNNTIIVSESSSNPNANNSNSNSSANTPGNFGDAIVFTNGKHLYVSIIGFLLLCILF